MEYRIKILWLGPYTNTFINEEDTLFLEGNVEQDITQMALTISIIHILVRYVCTH